MSGAASATRAATMAEARPLPAAAVPRGAWPVISVLLVVGLAGLAQLLDRNMPGWFPGVGWLRSVEYPVYAVGIGLAAGGVTASLGIRADLGFAVRTELFIKTGLVLLGASINLAILARAAGPAIAQTAILVTSVFAAAWWLGGIFRLDPRVRAMLAAALSICGVSAAIAAAGSVRARKDDLAYAVSLVVLFAVPSIFIQPWLAQELGLSQPVAGAWIGGNIDTTAAVTAAGSIAGDDALKVAAIVKQTQNAVIGLVAFFLAVWFVYRVERRPGERVRLGTLWERFPKFVLGFVVASAAATMFASAAADPDAVAAALKVAGTDLRIWFFTFAFVCIGLDLRVGALQAAGLRPVVVYGLGTIVNMGLALALATILFAGFQLS